MNAKMTTADGSNLGTLGIVLCSVRLGLHIFQHYFIVCQSLLHAVMLGIDIEKMLLSRNRLKWIWTTILTSRPQTIDLSL